MSTTTVSVEEAQTRLTELIDLAERGDEIFIAQENRPKVKLVPVREASGKRVFGQHRGKVRMAEDFDAPLPQSYWFGDSR